MMKFLTKYWKEVTIGLVFISMLIAIIVLFNKPQVTVTIEDYKNQNRIVIGADRPYSNKIKQIFTKAFPKVSRIRPYIRISLF